MRTFCFKNEANARDTVFELTLKIFQDIASSKSKRLRERSIPVWWGTATAYGVDYLIVGLKYDPALEVVTAFDNHFRQHPSFSEMTSTDADSFSAVPYLRYEPKAIVVYAGPFDTAPAWKIPADFSLACEIRSYRNKALTSKSPFCPPSPVTHRSPALHSESVWIDNQRQLLKFVYDLKAPCGYRRLKSILVKNFGISVHEESGSDFTQYGLIRFDQLAAEAEDLSVRVQILINGHLDENLKYLVLCHEVSHYILHFRLLLLANLVNQTSWSIPEIGEYFRGLLFKNEAALFRTIEEDADSLAANFVVPPWFMSSADRITAMMIEGSQSPRPEEMVWRFLQPLFPESKFANLSWKNFSEMKERASKDQIRVLNFGDRSSDGLFERVFRAALKTLQRTREEKEQLAARASIESIIDQATDLLGSLGNLEIADARQHVAALISSQGLADQDKGSHDLALGNSGFRRQMIPPADWDGTSLYPVLPLVPVSYNLDDSASGDWTILGGPGLPGLIQEWQEWKRDHGLLLIGRKHGNGTESENHEFLTRDTFIKRLQLTRFSARLQDRDVANSLYIALCDFLPSLRAPNTLPKAELSDSLSFMVPGTPIHVNLKEVPKEAIETYALCYPLIQHQILGQPLLAVAALIKAIWKNLSVLEVRRGERCVIESLVEVPTTTSEEIALNLIGAPCRYIDRGCQFLDNHGKCSITLDATERTLNGLEKKKVVELKVLTDRHEWRACV